MARLKVVIEHRALICKRLVNSLQHKVSGTTFTLVELESLFEFFNSHVAYYKGFLVSFCPNLTVKYCAYNILLKQGSPESCIIFTI